MTKDFYAFGIMMIREIWLDAPIFGVCWVFAGYVHCFCVIKIHGVVHEKTELKLIEKHQ